MVAAELRSFPSSAQAQRTRPAPDFLLNAVSKACLNQALKPCICSDAIPCGDGSAAMAAAALDMAVHHEAVNLQSGQRVCKPSYIQRVNSCHGRLKGWIARFKGMATESLASYLAWFRALERTTQRRLRCAPMLALALGLAGHH